MNVNSIRLRELRLARQWSQDQLATLSGLNLRTIQRLESGAKISNESLSALAAVLEVPADSLLLKDSEPGQDALRSIRDGILKGLDFNQTTSRSDFWWFALAVLLILSFAKLLGELLGPLPLQIASLIVLLPWIAASTRRLQDAGLNPWWQLIVFVPVAGILVLLYLLTFPTKKTGSQKATAN